MRGTFFKKTFLLQQQQYRHNSDTKKEKSQLRKCLRKFIFFVKLRNKVTTSDINECPCCKRYQHRNHTINITIQYKGKYHPNYRSHRSDKVQKQRSFFAKTTMNKYTKISDLLRDFVQNYRKRSRNSNRDTHEITRTNNQTINQIVHHISN